MSIPNGPTPGNACPPDNQLPLLPHHLDELRRSGLTDDTIRAAGIYSVQDPQQLARAINWTSVPRRMVPAIMFPYRGPGGPIGYERAKPDIPRTKNGQPVKYESPKGRPNEVYIPPGTFTAIDDPTVPLLITEGEKKALAADQADFACFGLVGVNGGTTSRGSRLVPTLQQTSWRGRSVYIGFDSDGSRIERVQHAEALLAARLAPHEARVKAVRLPDGPPGLDGTPTKMGLDDFIVAHGVEALRQLIEEAEDPLQLDGVEIKCPASLLDPASVIEQYVGLITVDGVSRLRHWRGSWYWWGDGVYRERAAGEVRGQLIRHLNELGHHLTKTITNNHLDQLLAQALVPDAIDAPTWLGNAQVSACRPLDVLACRNGLINLQALVNGEEYLRPETPLFFNTTAMDYDFAVEAPRPTEWLTFLEELWPNDPESIQALQDWCGYVLTPDTRLQKILMMIGPTRSGKGTIARVLQQLIGPGNVAWPSVADFSTSFGLSELLDKSLAIVADAQFGGRDSKTFNERILNISGEDPVHVNRKYLPIINRKLFARLMLLANELPRFNDPSGALAGRMVVLRLTQSWLGREDIGLTARLISELPAILLWAIQGWERLRARGAFQIPERSVETQEELQRLGNPVRTFVNAMCEWGADYQVLRGELYQAYRTWADRQGRSFIEDEEGFGRLFHAAFPTINTSQPRSNPGRPRVYCGLRLLLQA